jgi:hypothetical protein
MKKWRVAHYHHSPTRNVTRSSDVKLELATGRSFSPFSAPTPAQFGTDGCPTEGARTTRVSRHEFSTLTAGFVYAHL